MRPAHFRICRESDNGVCCCEGGKQGRIFQGRFSPLFLPSLSACSVKDPSNLREANLIQTTFIQSSNLSRSRSGDHALGTSGGDGTGDLSPDVPELVRGRAQEGDHLPRELHLRWIRAGRKGQLSGKQEATQNLNINNSPNNFTDLEFGALFSTSPNWRDNCLTNGLCLGDYSDRDKPAMLYARL